MHADPFVAMATPLPVYLDYLVAVARLAPRDARPLALRLHIPSFAGEADRGRALASYLAYLKREATMHAVLFAGTSRIRQLCFAGEGAADLPERARDSLLGHLHRHFRFTGGTACENRAGALGYPARHLVGCGVGALTVVGAVACTNVTAVGDYYRLLDRNELPVAQLVRRGQTEPYLMQVKDFQDVDQ